MDRHGRRLAQKILVTLLNNNKFIFPWPLLNLTNFTFIWNSLFLFCCFRDLMNIRRGDLDHKRHGYYVNHLELSNTSLAVWKWSRNWKRINLKRCLCELPVSNRQQREVTVCIQLFNRMESHKFRPATTIQPDGVWCFSECKYFVKQSTMAQIAATSGWEIVPCHECAQIIGNS